MSEQAPGNPWRYTLSDAFFGEEEVARVSKVLRDGWLTQGPVTQEFETRFAEAVGAPGEHAVAVSSCTTGLHLALAALGVGPGDEVIVPALTFVATSNAVLYVGANPVFAEVAGEDDLTIDPASIVEKITPRTRAVICVHYAGYPCRMREIADICRVRGLYLIEDAAHAPAAFLDGKGLGTWGDAGCFSFFSNKNLATGEGGMVIARDRAVADHLRRMRSHGMTAQTLERHKGHAFSYDVVELGYNFRITELHAAIGLAQLERLATTNARRRDLTARYREALAGTQGISLPFERAEGVSAHHIMPALLDRGVDRQAFMTRMKEARVQTSIHYPPIHLFTHYRNALGTGEGLLPRTEDLARREVTLPLHPKLSPGDVDAIALEVRRTLAEIARPAAMPS